MGPTLDTYLIGLPLYYLKSQQRKYLFGVPVYSKDFVFVFIFFSILKSFAINR